jgi:colicin import membrane protein
MTMQIQEYNETAAALAVLREKYCTVFDVQTVKGMADAREARADVRSYRIGLEKLRKEIKAPALERTRLIDEEAKRITAELLAIEEPIDQQIKAEETRKVEEKAAKERAEAARIAAIQARIAAIRNHYTAAVNQCADYTRLIIEQLAAMALAPDDFEEFMPEAKAAQDETRAALIILLSQQMEAEAEQARIKAEREELARLRQQDEERKADQARIEAEAKAKADEEAAAIRKAQEAEAARITAAQQELDERQRKIDEEEQRQAEERRQKAIADAKAKAEAEAAAIRQQQEAKAKNTRKKIATPLQEIETAIGVGKTKVSDGLRAAYEIGYSDGIKAGQIAA